MLPFGTQIGAFFYAGSGTPVSRTVYSVNNIPLFVDGRGSLGRTPMLSQTDLLVSHDIKMAGSKRMRFEANIQNLFNQKTARHIFDSLNRPRRTSSEINLANTNLANGYDYNALIAATPDGANAIDPRHGMAFVRPGACAARLRNSPGSCTRSYSSGRGASMYFQFLSRSIRSGAQFMASRTRAASGTSCSARASARSAPAASPVRSLASASNAR